MLDAAYAEARQAHELGRKAPVSLAVGTALTAAGKLSVPHDEHHLASVLRHADVIVASSDTASR